MRQGLSQMMLTPPLLVETSPSPVRNGRHGHGFQHMRTGSNSTLYYDSGRHDAGMAQVRLRQQQQQQVLRRRRILLQQRPPMPSSSARLGPITRHVQASHWQPYPGTMKRLPHPQMDSPFQQQRQAYYCGKRPSRLQMRMPVDQRLLVSPSRTSTANTGPNLPHSGRHTDVQFESIFSDEQHSIHKHSSGSATETVKQTQATSGTMADQRNNRYQYQNQNQYQYTSPLPPPTLPPRSYTEQHPAIIDPNQHLAALATESARLAQIRGGMSAFWPGEKNKFGFHHGEMPSQAISKPIICGACLRMAAVDSSVPRRILREIHKHMMGPDAVFHDEKTDEPAIAPPVLQTPASPGQEVKLEQKVKPEQEVKLEQRAKKGQKVKKEPGHCDKPSAEPAVFPNKEQTSAQPKQKIKQEPKEDIKPGATRKHTSGQGMEPPDSTKQTPQMP